jgi:hypothetical protein
VAEDGADGRGNVVYLLGRAQEGHFAPLAVAVLTGQGRQLLRDTACGCVGDKLEREPLKRAHDE